MRSLCGDLYNSFLQKLLWPTTIKVFAFIDPFSALWSGLCRSVEDDDDDGGKFISILANKFIDHHHHSIYRRQKTVGLHLPFNSHSRHIYRPSSSSVYDFCFLYLNYWCVYRMNSCRRRRRREEEEVKVIITLHTCGQRDANLSILTRCEVNSIGNNIKCGT